MTLPAQAESRSRRNSGGRHREPNSIGVLAWSDLVVEHEGAKAVLLLHTDGVEPRFAVEIGVACPAAPQPRWRPATERRPMRESRDGARHRSCSRFAPQSTCRKPAIPGGGRAVAGSNPVSPTTQKACNRGPFVLCEPVVRCSPWNNHGTNFCSGALPDVLTPASERPRARSVIAAGERVRSLRGAPGYDDRVARRARVARSGRSRRVGIGSTAQA
jgi:hypothetical protein